MAQPFTYVPRREERPARVALPPLRQRLGECCAPWVKARQRLTGQLRRWWHVTTDQDFLLSAVSRRNAWKILLPAPGIVAMVADAESRGFNNLVILDAYATLAFLLVGYLPPGLLCSDWVISLVHAIYYSAHSVVLFRERNEFPEEAADSIGMAVPWGCQVLSVFAMASAGVHSVAIVGFNAFVAVASYFMHCGSVEQLVACSYVVAIACFAECRLAQLVYDVQGADFGYKALTLTSSEQDSQGPDFPRYSIDPLGSGATHSEGEDQDQPQDQAPEGLQNMQPRAPSRSALADLVLSHLAPRQTSRSLSRAEEMAFTRPRQRFAAAQVQMPGAASHEAPVFAEAQRLLAQDGPNRGSSVHSPSASSTAQLPDAQTLRSHALSNWSNEDSEQSPHSDEPPVPGTRLDRPVVLRGVKMQGFSNLQLNALFVESRDARTTVNGRETYWTESNEYFLYYSKATSTWGLAKARRFHAVKDGTSNGVAHSPEGYELWDPANSKRRAARALGSWREWDTKAGKWLTRPNSGIENRGKVRPKEAPPSEKAVQTELTLRDQECQTDPSDATAQLVPAKQS